MSNEIRRRRTDSPEIDAMLVIEQAIEPLDEAGAARVLSWALARWVPSSDEGNHLRTLTLTAETVTAFAEQTERLREIAREVGLTDQGLKLVFKELAEKARAAEPVES